MAERFRPYVTVAAIIECRNKFIMVSEIDDRPYPVFGQPAGHLEAKEDLVEAVSREILEETGLQLEPQGLCGIYTYVKEYETIQRYCFYVKNDLLPDKLVSNDPDHDILSAKWYTKEEIINLESYFRTRLVKICFKDYWEGKRFSLDILTTI
ncbi:MAG: NUDIX domain-containing protein [Succinivibrionaceae bacterium]